MNRGFVFDSDYWLISIRYYQIRIQEIVRNLEYQENQFSNWLKFCKSLLDNTSKV